MGIRTQIRLSFKSTETWNDRHPRWFKLLNIKSDFNDTENQIKLKCNEHVYQIRPIVSVPDPIISTNQPLPPPPLLYQMPSTKQPLFLSNSGGPDHVLPPWISKKLKTLHTVFPKLPWTWDLHPFHRGKAVFLVTTVNLLWNSRISWTAECIRQAGRCQHLCWLSQSVFSHKETQLSHLRVENNVNPVGPGSLNFGLATWFLLWRTHRATCNQQLLTSSFL